LSQQGDHLDSRGLPVLIPANGNLPETVHTCVFVVSNSVFLEFNYMRQMLGAGRLRVKTVPIICEDGFRFPSGKLLDDITEIAPRILAAGGVEVAGATLAALVKQLFIEIAIVFAPADFTSTHTLLTAKTEEIAARLRRGSSNMLKIIDRPSSIDDDKRPLTMTAEQTASGNKESNEGSVRKNLSKQSLSRIFGRDFSQKRSETPRGFQTLPQSPRGSQSLANALGSFQKLPEAPKRTQVDAVKKPAFAQPVFGKSLSDDGPPLPLTQEIITNGSGPQTTQSSSPTSQQKEYEINCFEGGKQVVRHSSVNFAPGRLLAASTPTTNAPLW